MLFLLPSRLGLLALLWIWLLGGPRAGQAQPACTLSLSGRVIDHESRQALPGATVLLLDTREAVIANVDGYYHFQLCAGVSRLQVSFLGYESETLEVRMAGSVVHDIRLHPAAVALRGAVVRGTRVAEQLPQATGTIDVR